MNEEDIGSARTMLLVGAVPVILIGLLFAVWSVLTNGLSLVTQLALVTSYIQGESWGRLVFALWGLLIGFLQILLYALAAATAAFGAFKATKLQTSDDIAVGLGAMKINAVAGAMLLGGSLLSCLAMSCGGFVTGMVGSVIGAGIAFGTAFVVNGKLTQS